MPCGPCRDIRTAGAFAPAHMTGFFQINDKREPLKKGSKGCGVVLDSGVHTTVTIGEGISDTEIFLNGRKVAGETSRYVVEALTEFPVKVESVCDIPIGCGFGASGAGALGTAYALNQALSLEMTSGQLNDIAHIAEVTNGSGLGDVTAQAHGGILIRKTPGAPSIASVDRIPSNEAEVFCVVLGELSTRSILSDSAMVKDINNAGKTAMKKLFKGPSLENFMLCSKEFSINSGLAGENVIDIMETAGSAGTTASQIMLGNAVFAIPAPSERHEIQEAFSEFGNVQRFHIRTGTVRIT